MGVGSPAIPGPPGPGGGGAITSGSTREWLAHVAKAQGDDTRVGPSGGGSWPQSYATIQTAIEKMGGGAKCLLVAHSVNGPIMQNGSLRIRNESVRGGDDRAALVCAAGWSFTREADIDADDLTIAIAAEKTDEFGNPFPTSNVIVRLEHEWIDVATVTLNQNGVPIALNVAPGGRGAYGTTAAIHTGLGANSVCAVTTVLSRNATIGDTSVYLKTDVLKYPKIPARQGRGGIETDVACCRIRIGHRTVVDFTGKVPTGVGQEVQLTGCTWRVDGTPARNWLAGTPVTDHSLLLYLGGKADIEGLSFRTQANFTGACVRTETTDVDARNIGMAGPYQVSHTPGYGGTGLEIRWGEHHGWKDITTTALDCALHIGLGAARVTLDNFRSDNCSQTFRSDKETWGRAQAELTAPLTPTGGTFTFDELGSGTAGPQGRSLSGAYYAIIEHPDGDEEIMVRSPTDLVRGINGSGPSEGVGRDHPVGAHVWLRSGLTGGGWSITDWKAHEGREPPRAQLLTKVDAAATLIDLVTPVPPTIHAPVMGAFRPVGAAAESPANRNEVQTITRTSGAFALAASADPGQPFTADLGSSATAIQVQQALEALAPQAGLPAVGPGNILVTGATGGPYTVTFVTDLQHRDIPTLAATGATVAVTTEGDAIELVDVLDVRSGPNGPRTRVLVGRCPKRPIPHPASAYLYLRCKVEQMAGGVDTDGFDHDEGTGSVQAWMGDNGIHKHLTSSPQSNIILWGEGNQYDRLRLQLGAINLGRNYFRRPDGALSDPLGKAIFDELPDGTPIVNVRGSDRPFYHKELTGYPRLAQRGYAPEIAEIGVDVSDGVDVPHIALPDGGSGNVHLLTYETVRGSRVDGYAVFLEANGAGATAYVQLALIKLGKFGPGLGGMWELEERPGEAVIVNSALARIDSSSGAAPRRIFVPFTPVQLTAERYAVAVMTNQAGAGALFRGYRAKSGGGSMYGSPIGDEFAPGGIALAYTKASTTWGGTGSATWNGWTFHSIVGATPAVLLRRSG